MKFPTTLLLLATITTTLSSPTAIPNSAVKTIYTFPSGTNLENIAVRSNGDLLLTPTTSNSLYLLNPLFPTTYTTIATIPGTVGLLGITETSPDIFAIIAGNFTQTPVFSTVPGSFSIYSIDLRSFTINEQTGEIVTPAIVTLVANLPDANLPNGLSLLAPGSPYLLASDSSNALIYRINILTSSVSILLQDPLMEPGPNAPLPIGINGLHVQTSTSTLYFTNSFLDGGLLAKVPIDLETGEATGVVEIVIEDEISNDDFAIEEDANAVWVATNFGKEVLKIDLGTGSVVATVGGANSTEVAGGTSVAFGRGKGDCEILYVSTNVGNVVAIDTTRV